MRSGYRLIVVVLMFILTIQIPTRAQTSNYPPITSDNVTKVQEILRIGDGAIYDTAWSPDEHWVAIGSAIGIWIYDTRKNERHFLKDIPQGYALAFSPDGKTLVASDRYQFIYRWNTGDWKPIGKPVAITKETSITVWEIQYTRDGSKLLVNTSSQELRSALRILDATTLKQLNIINDPGHLFTITNVEFDADNSRALLSTSEGRLWLYDILENPAKPIRAFNQEGFSAIASAFSADYKTLYSVSADALRAWTLTGVQTKIRLFTNERLFGVAFAPDKKSVVIATRNTKGIEIIFYDLPNANEIARFAVPSQSVTRLQFNQDGKRLLIATQGFGLYIFDVESGLATASFVYRSITASSQAFSPDGKTLAVSTSSGDVSLWSIPDGAYIGTLPTNSNLAGNITFSPDGKLIAVVTIDEVPSVGTTIQQRYYITVFDAQIRAPLVRTDAHLSNISRIMFTPDSHYLLTSEFGGRVWRWDAKTGLQVDRYDFGRNPTITAVFLADRDCFLFSPGIGLNIASLKDKKISKTILTKESNIGTLTISPKEQYIALRMNSNSIGVFDLAGAEQARFPINTFPVALTFLDENLLAASIANTNQMQFWDWKSKKALHNIPIANGFAPAYIVRNADSSLLAVGSQNGTVGIYAAK